MPPQETDPIEKKSYTKVLFVLGSLFFLVSVWAFYDEVVYRRSWKQYQREFNSLELKRVQEEYEKVKEGIEAEELRRIRLKIEEAEVRREREAYRKISRELKDREIRLSDATQRLGFAKADQDEVYYEWKHAREGGDEAKAQRFKKEYDELEERLRGLKKRVEEAEGEATAAREIIVGYEADLKKWKDAEKRYLEPLEKLKKRIKAIRSRSLDIRQVVTDDLGKGGAVVWGTVDRCQSCHVAIDRDGFENEKNPFKTHPFQGEIFGRHPPARFGCTTCHGGQGRATQIKGPPLGDHDFAHGLVHHWTDPLLRGDFLQSSCNKCHQDQWRLDHAPVYMAGKRLFWDRGCTGCHLIKGFENAPKVGASLRRIEDKVSGEWLVSWIKDPRGYLPHARMPKPALDIEESGQTEKVAAYLFQESERYAFPFGPYPGGDAVKGERVFEMVGCLGCHVLGKKGTGLAPELDRIVEKTSADWIYNWIQDPKSFSPDARMPDFRLTPEEAADVTAFLLRQGGPLPEDQALRTALKDPENSKKGFLLVSQYGCYGCHDIKGFEKTPKLSVELTSFGKKDMVELDFGDTDVPRTWEDWTAGKLKDPRRYLTEKTSSRMPHFGLSDEEAHALVVFLKGLRREEVPERFLPSRTNPRQREIDEGRRLVGRLHCRGCHLIEGEGRLIESVVGAEKSPPVLDGIGARVRPDWMHGFLKDPSRTRVRPWIEVRMPTFGFSDQESNTVIGYFSALDRVPTGFSSVPPRPTSSETIEAGKKLASADYFSCLSCHIQGGKIPPSLPEQWGPDLALARERLRPDFIPEWVKGPQKFTPGVKMPAFLPSDDAAPPDILGGNRDAQAEAIRDYLLTLGGPSEGPAKHSKSRRDSGK